MLESAEKSLYMTRQNEGSEAAGYAGKRQSELVPLAVRVHPFPFRTRKLSSPAPKILVWRRTGKIGRRQHKEERQAERPVFFSVLGCNDDVLGGAVTYPDERKAVGRGAPTPTQYC